MFKEGKNEVAHVFFGSLPPKLYSKLPKKSEEGKTGKSKNKTGIGKIFSRYSLVRNKKARGKGSIL